MHKSNALVPRAQTECSAAELGAVQGVKPLYLTYRQAETYTGLSRTTLWKLVSAGEMKASRVGRAVRLDVRSVEDYMERAANDG